MKVVLLGASGFIGSHILEFLSKQEKVNVVATYYSREIKQYKSSDNYKIIKADLRNPEEVRGLLVDADMVIQAAAITTGSSDVVNQPHVHVTDNAIMNSLILRECHLQKVKRFIFFSCTVMYQKERNPSNLVPVKETDDCLEEEIYSKYHGVGWTKVYIEKMCKFYSMIGPLQSYCIRHSNIYGPNDKFDLLRSHVLGATINKVINSESNEIVVWGNGEEARDFLYIDDLIDAVSKIINNDFSYNFRIWNIGSSRLITISDLVKNIINISGRTSLKIKYDSTKPTINTKLHLDCSKAKNDLLWSPTTELNVGLRKTIKWYLENK